jgi:heptosyltransferase-2
MKIFVVAPSWIGDTVAAQPLLARLHERHPGLVLDVMAPGWVAPVLHRMPEVREVIANPFPHGQLDLLGRWRLGRQLARDGYDEAIVLPNSWKSALVPFFAGIPARTGFTGEARYGLINNRHRLDDCALPRIVQRYAALAHPPGSAAEEVPEPRLESTEAVRRATLGSLGLTADAAPVALCPGAEYGPAKRWPAQRYAALARALAERGHAVWLIGSVKDRPVAERIEALAPGACRNLCGTTGLDQAIDLLASAGFVVTNDSGLMHVAAALNRPMVALFGSSSPRFTPPLSGQAEVIWLELECSPCFERECPLGHFRCMLEIEPSRVLNAVLRRLPEPNANHRPAGTTP